jgi:hypothetical protein
MELPQPFMTKANEPHVIPRFQYVRLYRTRQGPCGGESRLLQRPETFPAWENPNMLAKYYVSTKGVELSQRG